MLLLLLAFGVVELLIERLLFPELFSWTQWDNVREYPAQLMPWFERAWMNYVFVLGAMAWLLYVAYLCLRDHEATDGV